MISLLIAGSVGLAISIFGTPWVIAVLRRRSIGQFIQEEITMHAHKQGIPTMGGLVFVGATVVGYLVAHVRLFTLDGGFRPQFIPFEAGGLLAVLALVGMGVVGFLDDYVKFVRKHSDGLNKRTKFGLQLLIAIVFAVVALQDGPNRESAPRSRSCDRSGLNLGVFFVLWALFMLTGAANGVNLADGMDGLAGGSAALVTGAYTVISFWQFRNDTVYQSLNPLDLAVGRRRDVRGLARLSVVERAAGADHHGRRRVAGNRWFAGGARSADQHSSSPRRPGRGLRRRDSVGHDPGSELSSHRAAGLPDDSDPFPLRSRRMAGDHHGHPFLDPDRNGGRPRARPLLRRLPEGGGLAMRVLVLGAGVSGLAAARLAYRLGHDVTVYDHAAGAGLTLIGEGIGVVNGRWDRDLLAGIDLVVTSPGVPLRSAPITDAREAGVIVWSEIEFAWRHLEIPSGCRDRHERQDDDHRSHRRDAVGLRLRHSAVGNIGTPLSDVVGKPNDLLVVEVSSFQLDLTEAFHPPTAVLLNIAPDHLDWHPSIAAYIAAKAKIFANQDGADLLVFDADDAGAAAAVKAARSRLHPVSGVRRPNGGSGPADGTPPPARSDRSAGRPRLGSSHVGRRSGCRGGGGDRSGSGPEAVGRRVPSFPAGRPSPRGGGQQMMASPSSTTRRQPIPTAALASIQSFETVVLIAGGLAKGLDITPLAQAENVRSVVAIGESAPVLLAAAGQGRGVSAGSMTEAVAMAERIAQPGDTVLLAPGCASFDMFD